MYSWSKNLPTLTEAFFGKGNSPTGPVEPVPTKEEATPEEALDTLDIQESVT